VVLLVGIKNYELGVHLGDILIIPSVMNDCISAQDKPHGHEPVVCMAFGKLG
jgi:hypothetical protein